MFLSVTAKFNNDPIILLRVKLDKRNSGGGFCFDIQLNYPSFKAKFYPAAVLPGIRRIMEMLP
jgi:hypothetical protein